MNRHGYLDTGGSFTQIDVPGAIGTEAFGINDAGQIVGRFDTGSPVSFSGHGYLDTGGSFTQIDVPGAVITQALGINDAGQIVVFCAVPKALKQGILAGIENRARNERDSAFPHRSPTPRWHSTTGWPSMQPPSSRNQSSAL
jgi:hypothetical protein